MNRNNLWRLPLCVTAAGFGILLGTVLPATSPEIAWAKELPTQAESDISRQGVMYGIGSTSKMVVAAAVMKLADEGRVDLDSSLTTYIPDFEMADIRYPEITPRMLLDHTSGIPGSTLTNAMLLGDSDTYNHDNLLEALKTQRLKADPGEYGTYCNDGFTLAEILVERITGMSFTAYIEETFSKPLGLEYFKTPQSPVSAKELAPIYDGYTGWELPPEAANAIGSGGVYATAEDLCRFSQIFMTDGKNAGQFLSTDSLNQMKDSVYSDLLDISGNDTTLEYGLGWDSVNTYPFNRYGIRALTKGGDTSFYHASLTVLPEEGISCAMLSSGGSSLYNMISVQEILLDYLEEIERIERDEKLEKQVLASEETDAASMPEDLTEWSGWYDGSQMFQVDIKPDGTLTITGSENGYLRPQTYVYQSDGRFHSTAGSYYNSEGKLVKAGNGRTGRTTLDLKEGKEGRRYLMSAVHETYPGLGNTAMYLPMAEKMSDSALSHTADTATMAAWQERDDKEYYLVSEKYSSVTYTTRFMVKPDLLNAPEGYLGFKDGLLTMARLTDPLHAEFFQQIPGQAGRDLSDYRIIEKGGHEYLESGSHKYLSEEGITPLPDTDTIITIGSNGEALWFSSNATQKNRILVIETPEHGSYFLYDHGSKEVSCVGGSYFGAPGQQITLPKDGRIVFVGDAGAEFNLHYVN